MVLSGPSRAGKSTFIANLVKNIDQLVYGSSIKHVIWCYKNENSLPNELKNNPNVTFQKNIPEDVQSVPEFSLIIFDDLMLQVFTKEITEIFTVLSHHNNISVILVLHNIFFKSKFTRDIMLNTQYIVYFKNPRDLSSISHFARQLAPTNSKNLQNIINDITSKPYSYVIIDLCQETPEIFKFRSNIFEDNHYNCYATETSIEKFMQNENY